MAEDSFSLSKIRGDEATGTLRGTRSPSFVGSSVDATTGNSTARPVGIERSSIRSVEANKAAQPLSQPDVSNAFDAPKESAMDKALGIGTSVITSGLGSVFSAIGGGRVICTELVRQGLMDRALCEADMRWSIDNLGPIMARGYHAWAIPYTRLMRRSPLATRIARPVATWRARELAYKMGLEPTGCRRGKVIRLIFEPACWVIGLFVADNDFSRAHRENMRRRSCSI